jgi:hypothetical protein
MFYILIVSRYRDTIIVIDYITAPQDNNHRMPTG